MTDKKTDRKTEKMMKKKTRAALFHIVLARSLPAAAMCLLLSFALVLTACGNKTDSTSAHADTASGSGQTKEQVSADGGNTKEAAAAATMGPAASGDPTAAQSGTTAAAASAATEAAAASTADPAAASTAVDPPAATDGNTAFSAEGKGLVIVLDPGHSSQVPAGTEPVGPEATEMKDKDTVGTSGPASGLNEYELTMQVSQKLRAELEDRGYTVKLTHFDTVRPISCIERAQVANENKADAFIRIHANSSDNKDANGAMTICISQDNPYHPELYAASARLSEVILDTYCLQTEARQEYVWETDDMTGNNWAEMPATMIELGYMSNTDEDLKMAQDSYQKKMVNAIADGLERWFAEMPEEELSMHPALTGETTAGEGGTSSGEGAATAATEQETAEPNAAGQNAAEQDAAESDTAGQDAAEPDAAEPNAAGQDAAEPDAAGQNAAAQDATAQNAAE